MHSGGARRACEEPCSAARASRGPGHAEGRPSAEGAAPAVSEEQDLEELVFVVVVVPHAEPGGRRLRGEAPPRLDAHRLAAAAAVVVVAAAQVGVVVVLVVDSVRLSQRAGGSCKLQDEATCAEHEGRRSVHMAHVYIQSSTRHVHSKIMESCTQSRVHEGAIYDSCTS